MPLDTYVILVALLAKKGKMPSFIEAVGESINRASCVILGDFAARLEVLQYVLSPLATSPNYNGAAAAYAARCGLPLPDDFNGAPPFTGGQCPGVQYDVSYAYDFRSGIFNSPPGTVTPSAGTSRVTGRVGGVRALNTEFSATAELFGEFPTVNLGGGSSGFPNNVRVENLRITGITRVDGLPDNCGNPPTPRPPYEPGTNIYNDNVTYNDNDNTEITIPVVIALGYATFNANAEVNIPVRLNFNLNPELDFDANFNFSTGGLTIDLRNPSAPRVPPGADPNEYLPDPSIPAPPTEIPDAESPDTDPDEPIEREEIISACYVTVLAPSENESVIFQDDNPDIYVPALGYVQFRIRTGSSSAWTADIAVKCKRQFIPCPWPLGAIDVRGTGRFGNAITVTPVRSRIQLINPYPD